MFTKEAQALAKPCYEAIKKIAEKAGKKCPKCEGVGKVIRYAPQEVVSQVVCSTCNGTGKVKGKWKWEPEVGERIVYYRNTYIITGRQDILDKRFTLNNQNGVVLRELKDDFIPFLHWERIEEILEGMGCRLVISGFLGHFRIEIYSKNTKNIADKLIASMSGKTCQEAVQRAVIELGKEE